MKSSGSTFNLTDDELIKQYSKKIRFCIHKIQSQKDNKIKEIETNKLKNNSKRQNNKKMFFFKQLADIVESVTGAATVTCGLNTTQNYLKSINVLKFDQGELLDRLEKLKMRKEQNRQTMEFVQIKMTENNGRMKKIEGNIGYTFKNKLWLVEALTHKSYID
jgi:dsRNA-specific ribonuclease